jgi:hypothetical protein
MYVKTVLIGLAKTTFCDKKIFGLYENDLICTMQ